MVTRKEVAELAKVSEATVSYVVNNTKNVTPEVRERVLAAVHKLGYRPNMVARSLVTKETRHVAMLVDNLKNPYYCEILEGAQSIASEAGYIVSVLSIDVSNKESVMELASRGVDGIIFAMGSERVDKYLKIGPPCVYVGENVYMNYQKAIDDMVGCLVEKGHRNIAMLCGIPLDQDNIRYQNFVEAVKNHGLHLNPKLIVDGSNGRTDEDEGARAMTELLSRKEEFTAVYALNDLMAMGAMKVTRETGIRIPEDVSIIGCDNLNILRYLSPALSTMDVEAFQVGRSLMQLLIEKIKGEPLSSNTIETRFICRETVAEVGQII
ncbi:MAG TPA: LacI family transcriptional regulator [Clostridiales bacterium]|nr:LacI family transcriptional regulator [Clostridiales bacterium]